MARKFLSEVLDFLVPRFCVVCQIPLNVDKKYICAECESKIDILDDSQIESEFNKHFRRNPLIDGYTSLYAFEESGNLQNLIHALKYDKKFKIGIYLGEKLAVQRKENILSWGCDFIVPVPLFKLKKIERNFNQAFYIAKGISEVLDIPILDGIVKRTKNTSSQTALTIQEREENVSGAFSLKKPNKVKSKKIIVADDVITTGATIKAIAEVLRQNGAEKVYALSVANPPVLHSLGST